MENTFTTREEGKVFLQGQAISLKFKLHSKGYNSRREVFICHLAKSYTRKSCGIWNNTSTIITDCPYPYKVVLHQNHKNDMLWSATAMNNHNHSNDCHVKVPFTTEELQVLAQSRYAGIKTTCSNFKSKSEL
jgi:hypothetical protein